MILSRVYNPGFFLNDYLKTKIIQYTEYLSCQNTFLEKLCTFHKLLEILLKKVLSINWVKL